MKRLWTPVNLIFVIAEVGTLSQKQLHMFKTKYKDGHFGSNTILTTFSPKTLQVVVIWSIRVYQPPIDKDGEIAAGDIQIIPELILYRRDQPGSHWSSRILPLPECHLGHWSPQNLPPVDWYVIGHSKICRQPRVSLVIIESAAGLGCYSFFFFFELVFFSTAGLGCYWLLLKLLLS